MSAGLAEDLVRLAFLLSREWVPYPKWLGTRLAALPCAAALAGPLRRALAGADWREREGGLADAARVLLREQRERGLPTPDEAVGPFHDRPFLGLRDEVTEVLLDGLADPWLARRRYPVGSVGQWVDNVGVLTHADRRAALSAAYRIWLQDSDSH
jgi:hypothetical protein